MIRIRLTKFDISIRAAGNLWRVLIKTKVDSSFTTYAEAEARWIELTAALPELRG